MRTTRPAPGRRLLTLALALALPLAAGCGGGKGTVTGRVTYKGDPLPYGNVQFFTSGGAFVAEIKADGTYTLPDVPAGPARISVNCQDPKYADFMKALSASARDPKAPKPKGRPEDFDKIPSKYNDPDAGGLTYTVKSGTQTHDIPLN
jgi:hypothetical protein